jgi:hypothetical protein
MPKFDVTIWYTVTYTHNVEIEADNIRDAEKQAKHIFENANVTAQWGYDDPDLEIDVWEIEEES